MRERRSDPFPLGGGELPFSKGLTARALMATGVSALRAYELAQRLEADLAEREEQTIDFERLEELASEVLGENEGAQAARRLRRYQELRQLEVPIILLIGGTTGTGKSTVATEVAYRLGITRVTSTDFIRQTMRAFFSQEFMASIHYSSFEAGQAARDTAEETGDPVLAGFLDQTRNVLVGVQAALDRVLQEGWSMVLEGVPLVPGMLPPIENALVVQCVLEIEDEDMHESHFWVRDAVSQGLRPVQRYIDALGDIRFIQDYIVERARRSGVPIVENSNIDLTIATVMELVLSSAERLERV